MISVPIKEDCLNNYHNAVFVVVKFTITEIDYILNIWIINESSMQDEWKHFYTLYHFCIENYN